MKILQCMECGGASEDLFRKDDLYVCCTCKYGSGLTKRSERDPMAEVLTDVISCGSYETIL